MGVPVVTLAGDRPASREAASLLRQAGLPGFIAGSPGEYLDLALHWFSRPQELAKLREGMRDQLRTSRLLDGRALARDLESAYRSLWSGWCQERGAAN